jgi:hypothetical protein
MKILCISLAIACAIGTSGCATQVDPSVQYVQGCAAYAAAFSTAVSLRQTGKLSQGQIDTVTLLDSQITPICTGPLPSDPSAMTVQVTSAVTSLLLITAVNKVTP